MAMVVTNNMHYINISNAIRAAMGVSNQYKPAEMAAAINSIVDFYIQSVINNSVISNQAFEKVTSGSLIQTDNQYYGDIANSIRAILGTSNLYKPSEMSTAILEIINILSSTSVIAVSAPSGSTVTCTNGNIDKTPLVKDGKWYFWGCGNGEWIIKAILGSNTSTETINIVSPNKYDVTITYNYYLFNNGDQCIDITGGWEQNKNFKLESLGSNSGFVQITDIIYILGQTDVFYPGIASTVNKVDLTNYNKINIKSDTPCYLSNAFSIMKDYGYLVDAVLSSTLSEDETIDISKIKGKNYICFSTRGTENPITVRSVQLIQ